MNGADLDALDFDTVLGTQEGVVDEAAEDEMIHSFVDGSERPNFGVILGTGNDGYKWPLRFQHCPHVRQLILQKPQQRVSNK